MNDTLYENLNPTQQAILKYLGLTQEEYDDLVTLQEDSHLDSTPTNDPEDEDIELNSLTLSEKLELVISNTLDDLILGEYQLENAAELNALIAAVYTYKANSDG